MKKKLLILLAVAALVTAVIAAPAAAGHRRSLRGHQNLYFNLGCVTHAGEAQDVSWIGTVDLNGVTYDIVYRATNVVPHGDWVYFEENVEIHEGGSVSYTYDGGVITEFEEGEALVEFTDEGWNTPWSTAFAPGKVTGSTLPGVDVGDRTFWRGRYLDEDNMTFGGPFMIFTRG